MSLDLPRCAPSDHDTDPAAVLAFVDAADADPSVELHSLMVVRGGHVIAEGSWAPHTPERTRLLYSLSKSFTSTALGLAVGEGLLDLDDAVIWHYPEYAEEITDPWARSMTLRHLVSMASGHTREMWDEAVTLDPRDPVHGLLLAPPDAMPGTVFAYSQPCTYALASVIQRVTGTSMSDYLRPRLFDPLGIGQIGWQTWPPSGQELGFSGLFARVEDVAKLGVLYLQRGRWGDTQLVPAGYVEQATARQVATPPNDSHDWAQGYGFGFWMSESGYRGDGAYGQFCVVLPEHDAVVAITAGTAAMQNVLDQVWNYLLPGFGDRRIGEGLQPELHRRLQDLALPACVADPSPARWEDWHDQLFPVEPVAGGLATVTPRRMTVSTNQQGAQVVPTVGIQQETQQLEVTIAESANAITFPVGAGAWLTSAPHDLHGDPIPVAASGGWLDEQTLRVEVIFLESPHRMDMTCILAEGTASATAAWRDEPLDGGALRTLHRPR